MIVIIDGKDSALIAHIGGALRNSQIVSGKGALLVLDDQDGSPEHLLEKIIAGDQFVPGLAVEEINWKPECAVIVSKGRASILGIFEDMVPGFGEAFGPVTEIAINPKKGFFDWLRGE